MQARTEVESMLDVFNQNKYKTSDKHILEYTGDMSNPHVQRMVKHLNRALITDDYELLHQMLVEDEIESLLESKRQEHDEALAAKDAAVADKDAAIAEKEYWKALFEAEKQKNKGTKGK